MTGTAASNLLPLTVLLVALESWTSTGTIRRWKLSRCPAPSQLTGHTPTAPTCCWTYGTVINTTDATSSAVGGENLKLNRQASYAKKNNFFLLSLSYSTQFPHRHAISNNEPLHQRSAGICILQHKLHKTFTCPLFFRLFTRGFFEMQLQLTIDINELNLTHKLCRKMPQGRSSSCMMRMRE